MPTPRSQTRIKTVSASAPAVSELITDSFIDCINQFDAEKVRATAKAWKG